MAGSNFVTVGLVGINPDHVTCSEWVTDLADPQLGTLTVNLAGGKDYAFAFADEGVNDLAAAVGLSKPAAEWKKVNDAKVKAAEDALKAAAKEEADAAKAAAKEAEPAHKVAHKAHG